MASLSRCHNSGLIIRESLALKATLDSSLLALNAPSGTLIFVKILKLFHIHGF